MAKSIGKKVLSKSKNLIKNKYWFFQEIEI
jgi:hypothetical protein